MGPVMVRGILTAIALLAAATSAFAQPQWNPPKDVSAESKNGLFRVQAVALSKEERDQFRWEYRWHEKRQGNFVETHRFEVAYPSGTDLEFRLMVSPSGNGFFVDCSTAPALTFFDPSGSPLRRHERKALRFGPGEFKSEDGHSFKLYGLIPLPQGMTTGGDQGLLETGRFFLPLGAPVDDRLKNQALAFLAVPPEGAKVDQSALEKLVRDLDHQEPTVRGQASQQLVGYGGAAERYLSALRPTGAEVQSRISKIRKDILIDQLGYPNPERNVRLLAALLLYPDAEVAEAASRRLKAVLPEAVKPAIGRDCSSNLVRTAGWLQNHAERLIWDQVSGRCLWKD